VLQYIYFKIARLAVDVLYFRQGDDLYVQVPADLDQFR